MNNEFDNFDFDNFNKKAVGKTPAEKEVILEKRKKTKKISRLINIIICILAIILIFIIGTSAYLHFSPARNPKRLLTQYIDCVTSEKWDNIYKKSSIKNSSFFTEETFVEYCKENPNAMALTETKIKDFETELDKVDGNTLYYSVNYVDENGDSNCLYMTVKKVKDGVGKFDKYEVVPVSNYIVSYSIYAPEGTQITFGGKEIKQTEGITKTNSILQNNYSYGLYLAQYIPVGEYTLTAKANTLQDIETKITATSPSESKNESYLEFTLQEDAFNTLSKNTEEYITTVYDSYINGTLTEKSLPFASTYTKEQLDSLSNSIADEMHTVNPDYKVSSIKVTKTNPRTKYGDFKINCLDENKIEIVYDFDYDYTYNANYQGQEASDTCSDSGYFAVTYVYQNGEWKIDNILERAWF